MTNPEIIDTIGPHRAKRVRAKTVAISTVAAIVTVAAAVLLPWWSVPALLCVSWAVAGLCKSVLSERPEWVAAERAGEAVMEAIGTQRLLVDNPAVLLATAIGAPALMVQVAVYRLWCLVFRPARYTVCGLSVYEVNDGR